MLGDAKKRDQPAWQHQADGAQTAGIGTPSGDMAAELYIAAPKTAPVSVVYNPVGQTGRFGVWNQPQPSSPPCFGTVVYNPVIRKPPGGTESAFIDGFTGVGDDIY